MKILGHIHTLDDEEVIDRSLQALLNQTCPVDRILIVDSGSNDSTIKRPFPEQVIVIRQQENLGTSGAVKTGLEYALSHQYEWIWALDADSLPRKDALEKLVSLYDSCDPEIKGRIGILSCSQVLSPSNKLFLGRRLTPGGPRRPKVNPSQPFCECDSTIWSGSLFSLRAVRVVGLPRCGERGYWEDLSLDYGDVEFSYRIRQAGYTILVHRFSILDHAVGKGRTGRAFGLSFVSTDHPPIRRYLFFRNLVYFWLYIYPMKNWPVVSIWFLYRLSVTILGVLLIEERRIQKIWACFQGVWDGLFRSLNGRYE